VKIHCVWTRDLDVPYSAGRLKIARNIRSSLNDAGHHPVHHVLNTVLERKNPLEIGQAVWNGVRQRSPLQSWLFDTAHNRRIAETIPADTDVVYLDGIRTIHILERLRQRLPTARLVVDFDDLMSRRTESLMEVGEGMSPGYLTDMMPQWGRKLAQTSNTGLRYERGALRRWEMRVCELADEVVLLSPVEAAILNTRLPRSARATIRVLPPPQDTMRGPQALKAPLRFVFIGMDTLTQNRLTIEYLLDLWRRLSPPTPLHIFGRMSKPWPETPNVFFHGYVSSLEEVYDPHSILISPVLLRGGIKTKVLEAFAWGTPVVGNEGTFEGMALSHYPIKEPLEQLVIDIRAEGRLAQLNAAARVGNEYVRRHHDPGVISAAWRTLIAGLGLYAPPQQALGAQSA
jgi:glycosyltransferase involved in cell wall biosynthesis